MCKYTYMHFFLLKIAGNGLLHFLFAFKTGISAQNSVTSLEDHLGVPYCEIGAPNRWKLKKTKNCTQNNDCLCYSFMQVVH